MGPNPPLSALLTLIITNHFSYKKNSECYPFQGLCMLCICRVTLASVTLITLVRGFIYKENDKSCKCSPKLLIVVSIVIPRPTSGQRHSQRFTSNIDFYPFPLSAPTPSAWSTPSGFCFCSPAPPYRILRILYFK